MTMTTSTKALPLLLSTWSPGMLAGYPATVHFVNMGNANLAGAALAGGFISGIGHPATAQMAARVLGVTLPEVDPNNRPKVAMGRGDTALVVQYIGPRLKEGEIMHAPDEKDFIFLFVEVDPDYNENA